MRRVWWIASVLFGLYTLPAPIWAETGHPHGASFAIDCTECHTTEGWKPLRSPLPFAHPPSGFRFDGAHATAACDDCHESLVFAFVGTACGDCHRDPHSGELGFRCLSCHDTESWENQRVMFDVHGRTLFPLLRPHAALDCASCHAQQQPHEYATTPIDCDACHLGDYRSTTAPDHVAAGFPTECERCHSPVAARWDEVTFQHPATFVLDGAHRLIGCEDCHAGGSYAGMSGECADCHRDDYQGATDPDHLAGAFPTACEGCHNTTAWIPADFNHDLVFPLRGAHRGLDCGSACHADGHAGTPTDCFSCHRTDYQGTVDPDHVAAGYPTTCERCHSESAWRPATSDDHDQTGFPLRGAHQGLECSACHADGFAGTPTDCYSCHRADYNNTTDPDHAAAGFPTTCETCHNEATWDDAEFDHDQTRFPLRDSHAGLECIACHAGGYAGTPIDCYACHADDYDRANDPNHRAAGFPTTCESCHDATRWEDSNWDHDDLFPIYSGEHRGEWDACTDCHVAPASFAVYECIYCHEHNQSAMDREHRGVSGYRYESTACLSCHPDGGGDDD